MKISDIVDLAKAGYKPADVFKLLELVETSPKVQEAAPEDLPDAKQIKEEPKALENVPEINTKEQETDEDKEILDNLFKED